jgi:hypothetical protein
MLRRLSGTAPQVQFKLTIGAVNDPLEAEADRVADHVMRMSDSAALSEKDSAALRRKCATCEEEDVKTLRPKSNGQGPGGVAAPSIVEDVLSSPAQPLNQATRAFFEPRFGADFSGMRVHSDTAAAHPAGAVNALAYTVGRQIVLGEGATAEPTRLLAHELAHVVQQGRAGFQPHDRDDHVLVQRQPDSRPSLSMPAFPCEKDGGIGLCNFTTDSLNAPNSDECLKLGFAVIHSCKGKKEDCLVKSKCVTCTCLGEKSCRCTGIV